MEKIFISMPMRDRTDEEIIARLNEIASILPDCKIIDSFIVDAPQRHPDNPIRDLARSIELMADADKVFFATGWQNARRCRVEHEVAVAYDIPIIHEVEVGEIK